MNFRSEASSGASRPEARIWICEIESAKSIAELKTSSTITGAKLQTNFEVLDSKWLQEHDQRRLQEKSLY